MFAARIRSAAVKTFIGVTKTITLSVKGVKLIYELKFSAQYTLYQEQEKAKLNKINADQLKELSKARDELHKGKIDYFAFLGIYASYFANKCNAHKQHKKNLMSFKFQHVQCKDH